VLWPAVQTTLRVPPVALPPVGVGVMPHPITEPDPPQLPQLSVTAATQINPIRRPILFIDFIIIPSN